VTEVAELSKEYEQGGASVKELAQQFGIHRVTVTAHLHRNGVEFRRSGIAQEDILTAARLYDQGWSLMKLGAKYGVDSTTVWRALRAAGVVMRSPNYR
jgi:lambda repressor-like predicted transcriptional regulator